MLTLKMSEIRRSSVVDENTRLALQLESVKKERFCSEKADELKMKEVLTQQASNKTTEYISLCEPWPVNLRMYR